LPVGRQCQDQHSRQVAHACHRAPHPDPSRPHDVRQTPPLNCGLRHLARVSKVRCSREPASNQFVALSEAQGLNFWVLALSFHAYLGIPSGVPATRNRVVREMNPSPPSIPSILHLLVTESLLSCLPQTCSPTPPSTPRSTAPVPCSSRQATPPFVPASAISTKSSWSPPLLPPAPSSCPT